MGTTERDRELRDDFEPVLRELGFEVVELHTATVNGRTHLDLVIFSPDGVSIDDCADVHRLVMPRAELILDDRDLAVQVSSPGIDRVLKDNREFRVFRGQGVALLLRETNEWTGGVIEQADEETLSLLQGDERITIAFREIQKARLDYSQEVSKDHGR